MSNEYLQKILGEYGIHDTVSESAELLRWDCEPEEQDKEEFKLFYKVSFGSRAPIVVKFRGGASQRNERAVIESQTVFADILRENGISTPRYYKAGGSFTREAESDGYRMTVTAEDFTENEITAVNEDTARKTGAMLAAMHNIAEKHDCHVANGVIFDPFAENDLYSFEEFAGIKPELPEELVEAYNSVCDAYNRKTELLEPLRGRKRYAVQGDISDCNTFMTPDGALGVFDFNCCGDNILFGDAVMQGWFEAHLMCYAEEPSPELSARIFRSFMSGYHGIRRFSDEEISLIPVLYSVIDAFQRGMLMYDEKNLLKSLGEHDNAAVAEFLRDIMQRLSTEVSTDFLR